MHHAAAHRAEQRLREGRRFFNLDLHIGVVGDLRDVLADHAIELTDWTLSAHAPVIGRVRDPVAIVNEHTWRSFDSAMVKRFQAAYGGYLSGFDGFLATCPIAFSLLYEGLGTTVAVIATRYEYPFSFDRDRWAWLNKFIEKAIPHGELIVVANNRGDADYFTHYTGIHVPIIASLCRYTGATYTGRRPEAVLFTKSSHLDRLATDAVGSSSLVSRRALPAIVRWNELYSYRAIVHIPYNISMMAVFEQYTACVPLFFPSKAFLFELWKLHPESVLSELSFGQVFGKRTAAPRLHHNGEFDPNCVDDPDVIKWWIERADYYETERMPHISYFDSWEELREQLKSDLCETSSRMIESNLVRREVARQSWIETLKPLDTRQDS